MKFLSYNYLHSARTAADEMCAVALTLQPEIERIRASLEKKYATDYAACFLPYDNDLLERVQAVIEEKQRLQPAALVVIGIGGSTMGTQAVLQALYGKFYNEQQPTCAVYFVDTFDTDASYDVYLLIEQLLQEEKTVLLQIASKSGTTLETHVNAALFVDLIKRYRPFAYKEHIVVATDHGSVLWQNAQREGFACLEIPHKVGGRFSVFSAVSLFPLGLLGVDLVQLRAGAVAMLEACLTTDVVHNPAVMHTAFLDIQYYRGAVIHDLFMFSKDLSALGDWYRQLMAESLGKKYDRSGGLVRVGMLPTVSVGSIDLHSVGQLYLAGPRNRCTTFVTVAETRTDCSIPCEESMITQEVCRHSFKSCMHACAQGTMITYQKQELPFFHIELPDKSAYSLGQFLQMQMIGILYFGYLLEVNPFDQPEVELYKQEMRKLLNHE